MLICRDLQPVRKMLLRNEPATRSLYNTLFGRSADRARWVRVDDLEQPRVVICRTRRLKLYATDRGAGRLLLDSLPARWNMDFHATPSWVCGHVARSRPLRWANPCYGYALVDPSKLAVHREHRTGTLTATDAKVITRHWPYYNGRGESPYVRWRIEAGPTSGIRHEGKLVAWALTHGDGSLGFLHVLDEFRGRGMARAIGYAIARRSIRAGVMPFLFIETKNRASLRLTESMGFERVGRYSWFSAGAARRAPGAR